MMTKATKIDPIHAAELVDDAANFLTDENILPCDEGNAVAEGLATLGMNLRANAKLIAAAPELLEACQGLLYYYDAFRDQSPKGSTELDDIASFKAAIAKATT
jgi:hypothetical protein